MRLSDSIQYILHMEYCVQAWSHCMQKDIQILEKFQRAATKIVTNLKARSFEDRLISQLYKPEDAEMI